MYVCVHVCTYVCVCVHMCVHMIMCTYYVSVYIHNVCVHVCMCVHVQLHYLSFMYSLICMDIHLPLLEKALGVELGMKPNSIPNGIESVVCSCLCVGVNPDSQSRCLRKLREIKLIKVIHCCMITKCCPAEAEL